MSFIKDLDCFIQSWNSSLQTNSVLTVYKELKNDFEYEAYLNADIPSYYLKLFTQLRISCHKLRVETGRYGRNAWKDTKDVVKCAIPLTLRTNIILCVFVKSIKH